MYGTLKSCSKLVIFTDAFPSREINVSSPKSTIIAVALVMVDSWFALRRKEAQKLPKTF